MLRAVVVEPPARRAELAARRAVELLLELDHALLVLGLAHLVALEPPLQVDLQQTRSKHTDDISNKQRSEQVTEGNFFLTIGMVS